MAKSGSVENLIISAKNAGIVKMLVTSTATTAEQVKPINDFLKTAQDSHKEFFAFGTLYPKMSEKEIDFEIERMQKMGFRGVKLHPDFQQIPADSDSIIKIANKIAGIFPVLIHAGDNRYDYSNPGRIKRLLDNSPKEFTLIAAHMGGYSVWDEAMALFKGYENLYVDTCSSMRFLPPEKVLELINFYGEDRVLFGTDYPMWDQLEEVRLLQSINLSPKALKKIFFTNANDLFFN